MANIRPETEVGGSLRLDITLQNHPCSKVAVCIRVGALQEQGGAGLEPSSRVWSVHLTFEETLKFLFQKIST